MVEPLLLLLALREVSVIGKEMIDGNRAVTTVEVFIVMDINVFPNRSSTRDKETTKEVVDVINKYDLIPTVDQTEGWKDNYFLEFKVGSDQLVNLEGLYRQQGLPPGSCFTRRFALSRTVTLRMFALICASTTPRILKTS